MTRKFLFKSFVLSSMLLALAGCKDDDANWPVVDGGSPKVNLAMSRIRTDYDLTFHIRGYIADADGISSIRLNCPALSLNKTIDIIDIYKKPLTEYDLDYSYTLKDSYLNEFSGAYTVKVVVTDVAGNTETQEVLVTLDADFQAPLFLQNPDTEVTVLIKQQTLFNLKFTVEDNRNLDYVLINFEGVDGYPIRIEANGDPKLAYSKKIELPSVEKSYKLTITAFDLPAQDNEVRSTKIESLVKVQTLPDFARVYLADVETAEELNSDVFGVPMVCDHIGPYQYRARYYNEKAGTKICFIPQKTDFLPICFGIDPDDKTVLTDDPETAGKIVLDQAGVYYKIDFNTKTGAYSLSTYSVAEAVDPVQNLHYGQNDLDRWNNRLVANPEWFEWYFGPIFGSPKQVAIRMTQDTKNPHIYISDDWELKAGTMDEWFLHNWHDDSWWNYTAWRVDDPIDPSRCEYYGYYFADNNDHFTNNKAYFDYKYINVDPTEYKFMYPRNNGAAFDLSKWGSCNEAYVKNFVDDIKINGAKVPTAGKYRIWFDAHTERIKLLPVK